MGKYDAYATGATNPLNGDIAVKYNGEYFYVDPNGNLYPTQDTISRRKKAEAQASAPTSMPGNSWLFSGNYGGTYSSAPSAVDDFFSGVGFPLIFITVISLGIQWGCLYAIMYSWPKFISTLLDNYKNGAIDLAVILVTAFAMFAAGLFARLAYLTFRNKKSYIKKFVLALTISYTVVMTIIMLLGGGFSIIGIIGNVISGLILSILPIVVLLFVEHIVTKKDRNDNTWFISKLAVIISKVYIGKYIGMFLLGILWSLLGGIFKLVTAFDGTAESLGESMHSGFITTGNVILVMGIMNIVMAILAFKHREK